MFLPSCKYVYISLKVHIVTPFFGLIYLEKYDSFLCINCHNIISNSVCPFASNISFSSREKPELDCGGVFCLSVSVSWSSMLTGIHSFDHTLIEIQYLELLISFIELFFFRVDEKSKCDVVIGTGPEGS